MLGDKPPVQSGARLCGGAEVGEFRRVGIGVKESKGKEKGERERRGADEAGVVGGWRASRVYTVSLSSVLCLLSFVPCPLSASFFLRFLELKFPPVP